MKSIQEDYTAQRKNTLLQFHQELSFEAISQKIQIVIEAVARGV